ncbi:MAG: lipoyl(octanoyl) transferase LipB [Myxococcota bacterium]
MVTASGPEGLILRRLGVIPYDEALALQTELRDRRLRGQVPDTVLLLEHPHVITFGRGSRPGHVHLTDEELRRAGYDVHRVNRGGDVTYHGPGQLVGYPILDLSVRGRDVHVYLRRLESVLIETLAEFGVMARRREHYAGVWIDGRTKIASIGVGLRRWVTLHGFALNVCCDLGRFDVIVPCGLPGVQMTSLSRVLGRPVGIEEVCERLEPQIRKSFA